MERQPKPSRPDAPQAGVTPMIARAACERRDAADPLGGFRDRFALPPGIIYLDGNSLGALPRRTAARLAELVAAEWGRDLITSWNKHRWIDLPRQVGHNIAPLLPAAPRHP